MLPAEDREYLDAQGWRCETTIEAGVICVVIYDFELPAGYTTKTADLLIHVPVGYPDTPLDMWWFAPAVTRSDGIPITNTESSGVYVNRTWQRWSRHYLQGQWQPGIDNVETYIARIRGDLRTSLGA